MKRQTISVYKLFCKEVDTTMRQHDVKTNIELIELVERKALEFKIHPKLVETLVNFYWAGIYHGLGKAYFSFQKDEQKRDDSK